MYEHLVKQTFLQEEREELKKIKMGSEELLDMIKRVQRIRQENKRLNIELAECITKLSHACVQIDQIIKPV